MAEDISVLRTIRIESKGNRPFDLIRSMLYQPKYGLVLRGIENYSGTIYSELNQVTTRAHI